MVKEGGFIDFAVSLRNYPKDLVSDTKLQMIIELAEKIKELEARIVELEKT